MDLREISRMLVWWKEPEEVPFDYLARRVMDQGTWEMIRFLEKNYGREVFREALQHAAAGDFTPRSWNYWHLVLDIKPVPPLPVMEFSETGKTL
jgi:hypothetical protein